MMKTLIAQSAAEIRMTLRRGETLLLTVLIPLGLLVFFTEVAVIATPDARRIDFLTPGIMSLAVLSTSLVALSISTGFERSYGVLKRLRTTPLPMRTFIPASGSCIAVQSMHEAILLAATDNPVGRDHVCRLTPRPALTTYLSLAPAMQLSTLRANRTRLAC